MTNIEAQPKERISTLVKSITDLKRGELYKLYIHENTYGIATPTLRQEKFYIPENETDGESEVVSDEGLVRVVIVGEDGETESSYRLADLGVRIEKSAKVKKPLVKSPPSPNTMAWANWVEKVPVEESTSKNP